MRSDAQVPIEWDLVDAEFEGLEPRTLLAVLSAAADSPGCRHRLPSVLLLWARAVGRPPVGRRRAGVVRLRTMLKVAGSAWPPLIQLEDWWPPDPRLIVRYKAGGSRLQLHPGLFDNPVAILRDADDLAIAIDDEVDRSHGFRLSDLIEVTLRYSDWRLEKLRPVWPSGPMARDSDPEESQPRVRTEQIRASPIALTAAEISVTRQLINAAPVWIAECSDPTRGQKAWDWATVPSQSLNFDPLAAAPFGAAIAATTDDGTITFPACVVLGSLASAIRALAAEQAAGRKALRKMRAVVGVRLTEALGLDAETGGFPVVLAPGLRHAYAFSPAAGLDEKTARASIRSTEQGLQEVDLPALRARFPGFAGDGHIYPVLVVGGPIGFRGELNSEIPRIQLQELIDLMHDIGQMTLRGGLALFWQFIEDLHESRGKVHIASDDLDDIWHMFLDLGSLNPAAAQESTAIPDPTPSPSRWQHAAIWEPFEAFLDARGLPPSWRFRFPELDGETDVATMWRRDAAVTVALDPPLITVAEIIPKLANRSLDPAFGLAVADGIRLTLRNFGLWSLLDVPRLKVVLLTLRASDTRKGGIGIRTGEAQIDLMLTNEWFELLKRNAVQAHSILGEAIAECLDRLGFLAPTDRSEFVDAWAKAPPVAYLIVRADTLQPRHHGQLDLPRTIATRAWAKGRLAESVRRIGFEPAVLIDENAAGALRSVVVPAVDDAIETVLASWSPSAVTVVSELLNDVHAERFLFENELAQALTRPWAETWRRDARDRSEPSEMTRPVELLLELLLSKPPSGQVVPDQFDVARAVDLVNLALEMSLISSAAKSGMHGLAVEIDEVGMVEVVARPGDVEGLPAPRWAIDLGAYLAAVREERLRDREGGPDSESISAQLLDADAGGPTQFVPIETLSLPKSLFDADRLLQIHLGTGMNGLAAVLGTAVNWDGRSDKVKMVSREDLVREAQAWSSVPISEIRAAVDRLVLRSELLRDRQLEYWNLEGRSFRLSIRPLIELDEDNILLIPWLIQTAQRVFLSYLFDGRVPWPASELPQAIVDAFVKFRQVQNRELQRAVAKVASDLGLAVKERISEVAAARHDVLIRGDIDALIADPNHRHLWVCEIKDPSSAFSPSTIGTRVQKFLEPGGFVDQLRARFQAVQQNTIGALQLLGLKVKPTDWTITPLMVTRHIEPAGYAYSLEITFVTIGALRKTLTQP